MGLSRKFCNKLAFLLLLVFFLIKVNSVEALSFEDDFKNLDDWIIYGSSWSIDGENEYLTNNLQTSNTRSKILDRKSVV